jgi:uncharacterized protein YegP (UPF0339 family)
MMSHTFEPARRALRWLLPALLLLLMAGASEAQKSKGKMTFEVYKDKGGEFRWRLKADDKILAVPEDAYKSIAGAKTAVENIKTNAAGKKWKVEIDQDKAKEWRWWLKAANGQVMARSSKGFATKDEAEKAIEVVRKGVKSAKVVEGK